MTLLMCRRALRFTLDRRALRYFKIRPMRFSRALLLALLAGQQAACDSDPASKPKNPFDPPPAETAPVPKLTEPPKPSGPPDVAIDNLGPKVGFTRVLIEREDGKQKLAEAVAEHKSHFQDKEVTVRVDRKAKPDWLVAIIDELVKVGASRILVKTDTREEYPKQITLTPQAKLGELAACTPVAMILADRSTAVWKLSGGTASKRTKGFAGPDLSMTAETLERFGKGCKASSVLLLSGAESVEWGLVYDLAASATKLDDVSFDKMVLLRERPTAGRKVSLAPPS
jgi:biopolymer transport protein ExbD